ncbi:MAG: restriction endonuclease [Gammaproteobacteria bacterium]|nr:restriction endonuclease [Gammaproteobacteria bacterium]MBK9467223.1 restriction endonuclease [Gammaproteobacteria bacterium]MBP7908439.1 restriction endonuclease [Pseudomonadales bacterium]
MARKQESILEVLMQCPWWVSVIVSVASYIGLAVALPSVEFKSVPFQAMANGIAPMAAYVALIFLIPAPISAFNAWRKRELVDRQTGIQSIRALNWKQFEELVAEAYRRTGYTVVENPGKGADGGVDIRLRKDGQLHLVQCKQWQLQKVGVNVVREMLGLMTAESAASAIVICSGIFTQEAKNFAERKAIDLVDGAQLESLIGQVRRAPQAAGTPMRQQASATLCPRCGSRLVLRTARKGANAGGQFYGCSAFPKCRHVQQRLS